MTELHNFNIRSVNIAPSLQIARLKSIAINLSLCPLSTRSSCKLVLVPSKQQKEEVLAEKISLRFATPAFYCICLSRAVIAFALGDHLRTGKCTHERGKISKRERSQSDVHNLPSVQRGRSATAAAADNFSISFSLRVAGCINQQ
jgi:hypothetical protein